MKFFICLFALVAVAVALPQERVGALFTNDAIRQAQDSYLLPKDAQIQNVRIIPNQVDTWILPLVNFKTI